MHHASHHSRHAHQGEVLDTQRHVGVNKAQMVEQIGKENARHHTDKQRGRKGSAHASAAIGGCRCKHFKGAQGEQE